MKQANDCEYFEKILDNQRGYIQKYENSFVGRLFPLQKFQDVNEKASEFEKNTLYIKGINTSKIRNRIISFKQYVAWLKFRVKHIREIKIYKNKNISQDYLAIACIVKNEGRYLKEWVDFHLMAGVERIYVFDNESTDNTTSVLEPYIQSGKIIYFFYPGEKAQFNAYFDACRVCKKNTKWLALIDADEFLFPADADNLRDVLEEFEEYPAVGVNWIVFGPNNNLKRPQGLVVENYLTTFKDKENELNCRIKSIVQPKCVSAVVSPHYCLYKKARLAVDENKNEIVGEALFVSSSMSCTLQNSTRILRINHYWTKSLEDLEEKCRRGYPDGCANPVYETTLKRLDYPMEKDDLILKYIDRKTER